MSVSLTELIKRLGIGITGIGCSVERGELITRENYYQLMELDT